MPGEQAPASLCYAVRISWRQWVLQQLNERPRALLCRVCLQRFFPLALHRAVAEVSPGIKQRCVSIATQTTIDLLFRDYALRERDQSRIRTAGHQMVSNMAGSLAHATCKEPLRASVLKHSRVLIQGSSAPNERLDQATSRVVEENLDRGCTMIEEAASLEADEEIDAEISYELAIRGLVRFGPSYFH